MFLKYSKITFIKDKEVFMTLKELPVFLLEENQITKFSGEIIQTFIVVENEGKCFILTAKIQVKWHRELIFKWNNLLAQGLLPKELPQEELAEIRGKQNPKLQSIFKGAIDSFQEKIEIEENIFAKNTSLEISDKNFKHFYLLFENSI